MKNEPSLYIKLYLFQLDTSKVYNISTLLQEPVHFLNGKLTPESQMSISARDIGLLRGYAVFDFLITYPHHRPFHLRDHIDRLYNSAGLIGLDVPFSQDTMQKWVSASLNANNTKFEKAIRIVLTGGVGPDSITPSPDNPTIIIFIDKHTPYPKEYYEKGVGIIMVKHTRYMPGAKTNNYIEGVRSTKKARSLGAIEPVYYDGTQVFEGATCNIFALIGGHLKTPKTNILPGITRKVLLERLNLAESVEVEDFNLRELLGAKEVFLTASNKEVMPVVKVDNVNVNEGKVGEVTKEVMRQFRQYTKMGDWD